MVRVIATDLDGTLLKPKRKISIIEKENKNYIRNFYGDVVLVTGRDPKFCAKVCNILKIEHNFIALNGAIIVKNGNVIYRQSMKKNALSDLLEYMKDNYSNFEFVVFDKYDKITCFTDINPCRIKRKYIKHYLKNGRLHQKIKISNKKVLTILQDKTSIYKTIIYMNEGIEDTANILKSKYGEHFEFFASNHSIEISPKGVNKGLSLKYLIDSTTVKYDEVYVIGDGANDISMFEIFPNSFAITDASNKLKSKAKYSIRKISNLESYTKLNENFH